MSASINYFHARQQARSMSAEASNISKYISNLENMKQQASACWEGQASQIFQQKCNLLIQEMQQTRSRMDTLVQTIENEIERVRQEDEIRAQQESQMRFT